MPTLKEILADKEKYPDDMKYTSGDVETTLGDLRAYAAQENESVSATLRQRQADLEARQQQLIQQADDLAAMQAQLQEQQGRTQGNEDIVETLISRLRGPGKKTLMDLQDDEFFGPAVKQIREIKEAREQLANDIKAFRDEAGQVVSWMTRRELQRDFNSLPNRPKDLRLETVVEHATKRGYKDAMGYPDLGRAYDEIVAPERTKAEKAELRKQIRDEVIAEQRKAQTEKPVSRELAAETRGHVFVPNGSGKGAAAPPQRKGGFGGIDKIPVETILNDPDIGGVFEQ